MYNGMLFPNKSKLNISTGFLLFCPIFNPSTEMACIEQWKVILYYNYLHFNKMLGWVILDYVQQLSTCTGKQEDVGVK